MSGVPLAPQNVPHRQSQTPSETVTVIKVKDIT